MNTLRGHLAKQDGFTLVELLVAMSIGMVVMTAALALIDSSGRASRRISDKTETVQRARIGMDRIVRSLRTQVCLDSTTPPIASGDANSVTYFSDQAASDDASTSGTDEQTEFRPRKIVLTFPSSGSGDVVQTEYKTTSATPAATSPTWTFQTTADRTTTLLTNVSRNGSDPFLAYWSWNDLDDPDFFTTLSTTIGSVPPTNSIARIVRTQVSLRVGPTNGQTDDRLKTSMEGSVYTREADFSGQSDAGRRWGPRCA